MDKGTHFYRCDFQVHTPRDRQWQGDRPISEEERRSYAVDFIAACRAKRLDAVAITDHHDMAFIPYIREAAANELDAEGNLLPEVQRIQIFPGMELTLGIPCQALLIFGADFPDDMFRLATTSLTITPANASEPQCHELERLAHITTLLELQQELDKHEYLRGKYVILPNVSDGGASTLLRSGHSGHYKNMPCVGGYLDGNISQLGEGNSRILSGRDPEYGNKALALFQTSDNRSRDFAQLGAEATWVKWAVPTAEALRQACLAYESRISQDTPVLPSVYITSMSVSNSSFMGPINIEFSSQFNSIIGGRGTGKSTILEYLRWGLCDEAPSSTDYEDLPTYEAKRDSLIRQTLTALSANVQVNFTVNNVPHSVRRDSTSGELTLKIADGDFDTCSELDVRNLLPIQAYSQKQLSNVAVRLEELTRFIHSPIRQRLDNVNIQLERTALQMRSVYSSLQQKRSLERTVSNDERESRSLTEQVTAIRTGLTGINTEEQRILSQHDQYIQEEQFVSTLNQQIADLIEAMDRTKDLIDHPTVTDADISSLPNTALLNSLKQATLSLFGSLKVTVDQAIDSLRITTQEGDPIYTIVQSITTLHREYKQAYQAALAKSTSHEAVLTQLRDLEERLSIVRIRLTESRVALNGAGTPEQQFSELRSQWCTLHDTRSHLVEDQCSRMTVLSNGQIRATLRKGANVDRITERFRDAIKSSGIRGSKVENLYNSIPTDANPIRKYQDILDELELLAMHDPDDTDSIPQDRTPNLFTSGFTISDLIKISIRLTSDSWLDMCLTPIDDRPHFEYQTRENEYIFFTDASAGQQATSLLTVLLNQGGPPLIIDQPEDDLDNRVIPIVTEQIWRAKQARQLIFSSHNANLVVNGDAELVLCCDYRVTGEQSSGHVKDEGAIDVESVRKEITDVMEGGPEAFELRRKKYGF